AAAFCSAFASAFGLIVYVINTRLCDLEGWKVTSLCLSLAGSLASIRYFLIETPFGQFSSMSTSTGPGAGEATPRWVGGCAFCPPGGASLYWPPAKPFQCSGVQVPSRADVGPRSVRPTPSREVTRGERATHDE